MLSSKMTLVEFFVSAFFCGAAKKMLFVGNQIYSRGKCGIWPFFDVALGRFLMWHLAVF